MHRLSFGNFDAIQRMAHYLNDLPTLQKVVVWLQTIPQCQQALEQKQLLGDVDLQALHQLPNNTLGYLYADHMLRNDLKPPFEYGDVKDPYTFCGMHIGETHDIWHVITGCDVDKLGEIRLEAFCVAQLEGDRLFLTLLAKNLLKTAMYEVELATPIMDAITQGWQMGRQAKPLFGVQWDTLWDTPLEQVQTSFNVVPFAA